MEVRTYPVLRPSILCDLIEKGWSISVTEQDLREPKPETVQNIYAAILGDLLSLDVVRSFERYGQLAIGDIESPVSSCVMFDTPCYTLADVLACPP